MTRSSTHQRQYGQYFTPVPVVRCCYELLAGALPPQPVIADPACGDGAFLGEALAQALTPAAQISGCELDAALIAPLHAQGLHGIRQADGLAPGSLPDAAFDLVVGNPPFGVATSLRGPALASEVRFLLRALELARPGGLVALVLPNGVLANERLHGLRADLLARCALLAVVALPRATFRTSGTFAHCSLLLLRNAPAPPGHQAYLAAPERLGQLHEVVGQYRSKQSAVGSTDAPQRVSANCQLPTADHRPPTTDCRPPTADRRLPTADCRPPTTDCQPPTTDCRPPTADCCSGDLCYWLPQTEALAQRLDAHFWLPSQRVLAERMAARYTLRPLGTLLERRGELIAGDHVRGSRGEAKGPGLPYEYYQTREFLPAGYNYAQLERCDEQAYRRLRHTAVRRHDVLVSCAGVGGAGRGRVCLITHEPGPSCTGDVLILRPQRIDPVVLFLFLSSRVGREQLLRWQNGVGTVNLSAGELLRIAWPDLPQAQQQALAARYAPVAAAHAAAMAAQACGDTPGYAQARAAAEAMLAGLLAEVEQLLVGG